MGLFLSSDDVPLVYVSAFTLGYYSLVAGVQPQQPGDDEQEEGLQTGAKELEPTPSASAADAPFIERRASAFVHFTLVHDYTKQQYMLIYYSKLFF